MIKCENIHFSFPDKPILENFNMEVKPSQHLCIGGDSGKGKSTILLLIQAYLQQDRGDIWIEGQKLSESNIDTIRSKIAWVPQNIHLSVNSGKELLHLLGRRIGSPYLFGILEKLGLEPSYLKKPFDEISGGQKQRVILAICISLKRSILLLDEPTAALDEHAIERLINVLKELEDTTIVSVSHHEGWLQLADQHIYL